MGRAPYPCQMKPGHRPVRHGHNRHYDRQVFVALRQRWNIWASPAHNNAAIRPPTTAAVMAPGIVPGLRHEGVLLRLGLPLGPDGCDEASVAVGENCGAGRALSGAVGCVSSAAEMSAVSVTECSCRETNITVIVEG